MRRSNGPRQQPSSRRQRLQLPESSSPTLRHWQTLPPPLGTTGPSHPERRPCPRRRPGEWKSQPGTTSCTLSSTAESTRPRLTTSSSCVGLGGAAAQCREESLHLRGLDGSEYPAAQLTEAWKKAAFNGFLLNLAAGSALATYVCCEMPSEDFESIRQTNERRCRRGDRRHRSACRHQRRRHPVLHLSILWHGLAPISPEVEVRLDSREEASSDGL